MQQSTSHFERHHVRQHVNQSVKAFARILAPIMFVLAFASAAHAQGTIDMSGATTLMNSFKVFAMYAGGVCCLIGLIFAGIKMMSGNFTQAVPGLLGALFGAGVLGWGAGWITSLTGQSM